MATDRLIRESLRKPGVWLAIAVVITAAVALAWLGALAPLRSTDVAMVGTIDTSDSHVAAIIGEDDDSLIVGHHDGLIVSEDGGRSWSRTVTGVDVMAFAPTTDGPSLAGGHGFIGQITDDDRILSLPVEPPDLDVHSLTRSSAAPDQIWLTTGSGALIRSGDGGMSWSQLDGGPFVTVAAYGDDARRLYAVHAFDGFVTSEDGGLTWGDGHALPGTPLYAIATSADGGSLVVGTGDGAYLSHDAGATWERLLESPTSAVTVASDGDVAFMVTRDGEVYRYHRD